MKVCHLRLKHQVPPADHQLKCISLSHFSHFLVLSSAFGSYPFKSLRVGCFWGLTVKEHSGTSNISGWPCISNKYSGKYRTKFDSTLCLLKGWFGSTKPYLSSVYLEQIPFNFSSLISKSSRLWVCIFLFDLKRFCHYSADVCLEQSTILFSCNLTIFQPTFLTREVLRKCSIWPNFIPRWSYETALESFTVAIRKLLMELCSESVEK